ncbi:hypothetical protein, partial [Heyndrickxia coagulans]|uniref:hypothetical protein n=1 Tax=Heyndrickxia coagulans TaxID=1398 RepID=UPI00214DC94F
PYKGVVALDDHRHQVQQPKEQRRICHHKKCAQYPKHHVGAREGVWYIFRRGNSITNVFSY